LRRRKRERVMKNGPWIKLDNFARSLAPALITLGLILLSVMPTKIPAWSHIAPALVLMSVYYWAIYRPDLLPASAIFVLGLIADILGGAPVGVHAFTLLTAYGLVVSQRRFFHGKSFGVVWWGFMLVAAGVMTLEWLLMSLLVGPGPIDPRPALFSLMLTAVIYPAVAMLFISAHRVLPVSDD